MTTSHAASSAAPAEKQASKYVLQDWEPNNPEKWDSKLAWRTLTITTYSLILGFCVWFLPSAIAPKLTLLGFNLSASQLYWLTALPGLAAGLLRLVYMFLPPLIGTRKMVGITSLLFLIPMLGWFYAVQDNTTPYAVLLTLAFMCGIGGAAFSGYMPSTGYFFPKRLSGTALGLQGGIGNLGMSVIQLVGPILMGFGLFGLTWLAPQTQVGEHAGEQIWVYNAAIFFVPWCVIAAAQASGIPRSFIEAAQNSPAYKLIIDYKLALPLHPEFRTLPMVWYIPPLSPVVDAVTKSGADGENHKILLTALSTMRIPLEYLAGLFSAGDTRPVELSLRRLAAMRSYMRDVNMGQPVDPSIPESVGMTEEEVLAMYRLLSIAKYEDRYVIPTSHPEEMRTPTPYLCPVGEGAESGCGSHKGGKVPVSIGRRPE
ncbi:MFS transporter [Actinomyces sp. oral taxon 181]|uniref:MFS transporter n=1 Tax=Actinomyces sp. oral taxon 181 TaxID=712121 RepID=UPI0025BAFF7A|nr:MFS transporter [Actinomyces sp. oral taxon 181]